MSKRKTTLVAAESGSRKTRHVAKGRDRVVDDPLNGSAFEDDAAAADDSDDDNDAEEALATGSVSVTDDPIRMYLSQMASIPLLSRDEEISLAKKIEVSPRGPMLAEQCMGSTSRSGSR